MRGCKVVPAERRRRRKKCFLRAGSIPAALSGEVPAATVGQPALVPVLPASMEFYLHICPHGSSPRGVCSGCSGGRPLLSCWVAAGRFQVNFGFESCQQAIGNLKGSAG